MSDRYVIRTAPEGYLVLENLRTRRALRFGTRAEAEMFVRYEGGTVVPARGGDRHESP